MAKTNAQKEAEAKAKAAAELAAKAYSEMTQEQLIEVIQKKDEEIAEKDEVIAELNEELKDAKAGKNSTVKKAIVKNSKGEKFQMNTPKFKLSGRIIDAEILAAEPKLVDELDEMKSDAISKI